MKFKNEFSLEQRQNEANRVLSKYPNKIPVICENVDNNLLLPDIYKKKYLISSEVTIGQFIYIIRKQIKLSSEKALFLIINGIIPSVDSFVYILYNLHKDKDNFLYITFTGENTFG